MGKNENKSTWRKLRDFFRDLINGLSGSLPFN